MTWLLIKLIITSAPLVLLNILGWALVFKYKKMLIRSGYMFFLILFMCVSSFCTASLITMSGMYIFCDG